MEPQSRLSVGEQSTRTPHHNRYHCAAKNQHAELRQGPAKFWQDDQDHSGKDDTDLATHTTKDDDGEKPDDDIEPVQHAFGTVPQCGRLLPPRSLR